MNKPVMQFTRAERVVVKLKTLVIAPSGGGKTLGALRIAQGLAGENIAVIDSENDRALYYSDLLPFQHLSLQPFGFRPKAYMDAIDAAVNGGFEVVVIDSLSHAWDDVLARKEAYDRANPTSNGYANWKMFTKEWDQFVRHILDAPIHIIATARSKQSYELVQGDTGKKKVEKLGLQPTIREGAEYEFALVFDVLPSHSARCTKDNTGLFGTSDEDLWNLTDPTLSAKIAAWLKGATKEAPAVYRGPRFPKLTGSEQYANVPLPEVPREIIEDAYRRTKDKDSEKAQEIAQQMEEELERRNVKDAVPA